MGEEEGDQGGGGAARPEGELQEPALSATRWDIGLRSVHSEGVTKGEGVTSKGVHTSHCRDHRQGHPKHNSRWLNGTGLAGSQVNNSHNDTPQQSNRTQGPRQIPWCP